MPLSHDMLLVSSAIVSSLVSAIWEGSILALCVFGCLRIFPRLSAASRSIVWINVFLLLLLLHVVPSIRARADATALEHSSAVYVSLWWSLAVAAVWAALTIWRSTELILSAIRLHRIACRATPLLPDQALQSLLPGRDETDKSTRAVELCTSIEVERPCIVGFLRPRILLPHELLAKLSPLELKQVVLHEMEHLRRCDLWTNLIQKIGLTLFPLNPVLLWVDGRLCAERELACDDHVLSASGARKEYAICLTRMAEYALLRHSLSLALGAWERRSELARRVHRLLRGPGQSMSSRQTALVTGGLLCGVLGGAIALAHVPQLVSFGPIADAETQTPKLEAQTIREPRRSQPSLVESSASPRLVKVVTERRPIQTTVGVKLARRQVPRQSGRQPYLEDPERQNQAHWIVLTEWSVSEAPPRVVYTVARSNRPSYAALATPIGWLIVQI